jgi:hypothetical protein
LDEERGEEGVEAREEEGEVGKAGEVDLYWWGSTGVLLVETGGCK